MTVPMFQSIHPRNFLSFGPDAEPIPLTALNVLIGPNGSGKSNLLEAFEVLAATPRDLADIVRSGGGAGEWIWKGKTASKKRANLTATVQIPKHQLLRYRLEFAEVAQRLEVVDEAVEEALPTRLQKDVQSYYRYQAGHPVINALEKKKGKNGRVQRKLRREDLDPQQSVLSQRRDPDLYPEVTAVADAFKRITTFREWSFGRHVALRQAQPADLPTDILLPDLKNLGLVLNALEHSDRWREFEDLLKRFLPRFERVSTKVQAGHVQIYLHEQGLATPVPAPRLSDGTIRFIALLAILLRPEQASLICIDEPELGLHPDALSLVASLLVEAAATTQVIVTTHSDALVSALSDEPQTVVVVEHMKGATTLRRLDPEHLRFWLEKYRLGEVWRMGEIGGNP